MTSIRRATLADVPQMVDLSEKKRIQYQEFQPLFWRKAADSRRRQIPFFENLVVDDAVVALIHADFGPLDGFVIANLGDGRTCSVDDFALADEGDWETVGAELLRAVGAETAHRGIGSYLVVCGHRDQPKRTMLRNFGLTLDRFWYTAAIDGGVEIETPVRAATPADAPTLAALTGQPGRTFPEIERDGAILLVCEQDGFLVGFTSAIVIPTPPVYDPGGPTCLVLEWVVADPGQLSGAGLALLDGVEAVAARRSAVQYVVVCDASDRTKQETLEERGLTIASEWYVGGIHGLLSPRTATT